uniref:Uncharacterized protein n=1 Tax=Rhizoctonia solani hypovirus 3 TaxID=2599959 RepID=A0A5B8HA58_9VIRU|nr:hypothetical protein [Rhizoctonia solani hypovirus 3]
MKLLISTPMSNKNENGAETPKGSPGRIVPKLSSQGVRSDSGDELPGLEMVGSHARMDRAGVFVDNPYVRSIVDGCHALQRLKPLCHEDLLELRSLPSWIPPPISHPSGRLTLADEYIDTTVALGPTPVFLPSLECSAYKNFNYLASRAGLDLTSTRSIDARHATASKRTASRLLRRKEAAMRREIRQEGKAKEPSPMGSNLSKWVPRPACAGPTPTGYAFVRRPLPRDIDYSVPVTKPTPVVTVDKKKTELVAAVNKAREQLHAINRMKFQYLRDGMDKEDVADAVREAVRQKNVAESALRNYAPPAVKPAKVFDSAPRERVPHVSAGPSSYSRSDCFKARYSRSSSSVSSSPSLSKATRYTHSFHKALLDPSSRLSCYEASRYTSRVANTTTRKQIQKRVDDMNVTLGNRAKKMTNGRHVFDSDDLAQLRSDICVMENRLQGSFPVSQFDYISNGLVPGYGDFNISDLMKSCASVEGERRLVCAHTHDSVFFPASDSCFAGRVSYVFFRPRSLLKPTAPVFVPRSIGVPILPSRHEGTSSGSVSRPICLPLA